MKISKRYLEDLRCVGILVNQRIELNGDIGALCHFGDFLEEPVHDLSEKEWLVAQVIPLAVVSLEKYGEPFAIKGHHGSFSMETVAEGYLVPHGYLKLEKRTVGGKDKEVLLPTPKLLRALKKYFKV